MTDAQQWRTADQAETSASPVFEPVPGTPAITQPIILVGGDEWNCAACHAPIEWLEGTQAQMAHREGCAAVAAIMKAGD
jgi:hypothetical protein